MKILFIFIVSCFNSYLLKQDNTIISVEEVDAFVHGISSEHREAYVAKSSQFEKDVYTVLNINLVYDYLNENNLLDVIKQDQKVVENDFLDQIDKDFIYNLGYEPEKFNEILKDFDLKKQYVKGYQYYLFNHINLKDAEELAYEYYLANSEMYSKPKRMDLSRITLSKSRYHFNEVLKLKEEISLEDKAYFSDMAIQYSTERLVITNGGELGLIPKEALSKKIGRLLFKSTEKGFKNHIFEDSKNFYLYYINDIVKSELMSFESIKPDLIKSIKQNMADNEFAEVMARITEKKIDINIEEFSSIQSRYMFEDDKASIN